jgi:UDP-2,4-diacetamido-2,4,6-trideoxy-beta-L-altropyranose hydrolase
MISYSKKLYSEHPMNGLMIRKATLIDAETILPWRNSEQVRKNSFNPSVITKSEHLLWFDESLNNPTRHLLIAELDNNPIGVLRFDILENKALINIYLKPTMSGQGIGTAILEAGCEWIKNYTPEIYSIHANILSHNKASLRAFEKTGFQVHYLTYSKKIKD